MQIFDKLYTRLNTEQKKAVDTIEGPVMVIAGPGTGKTSILTLRIANILKKTDIRPENILSLTFTESGVNAMRRKLVEIIGSEGYKVNIYTFHSFSNEIIRQYPEYFPRIIGSTNASEIDQIRIIESILDAKDYQFVKAYGDPYFYISKIINEIKNLKREGVSPSDYKKYTEDRRIEFDNEKDNFNKEGKLKSKMISADKKINRNGELVEVYSKYQKTLEDEKIIDFEDMILELVKALENNEELLLILQEEYQYILADEHQDTNNAQNKVLELLASFHDNPNLFIVGDEKQAIFRFQGASLENFLYFKELYKESTLISLDTNYRSTQHILDNAHNLIVNNVVEDESLRKKLKGVSKENKPIDIYSFSNTDYENMFLVKDIEKKIKEGVDPEEIAILYRNNKDVFEIARFLEKTEIPFVIHSDQDLLNNMDIRKVINLLKVLDNLTNDVYIGELLHTDFFGIDEYDVHKIIYSGRKGMYKAISDEKFLKEIEVGDTEKVLKLSNDLKKWAKEVKNKPILEFMELIINESGLLKSILSESIEYERLKVVDAFFNEVRKVVEGHIHYTLKDLLNHFDILNKYNIRINFNPSLNKKGIKLMTAHRSKGLEFDYVYITNAVEKSWGKKGVREYFESPLSKGTKEEMNADERRLFYVAITRARKHVSITSSKQNTAGDKTIQTSFIEELDTNLISNIETDELETSFGDKIHQKFEIKERELGTHHKEYLNKLFLDRPFSVTALNNYLECPWRYFYSNLIRLPQAYSKQQKYGTAVHAAMNNFFNKYKEGDVKVGYLLEQFKYYIEHSNLSDIENEELKRKGEKALTGWYETYGNWEKNILNEYKAHSIFDIGGGEITLTGALDKIEFVSDTHVNIVDYKTASPKSRNDIEGNTKTSNGNYKRQLIFYKLLLEGFDKERFHMDSAEIDFVEPNTGGKFKTEKFEITDEEVKELSELIIKVSKEILDLKFWDEKCDDKECEYCGLRG